MTGKSPTLSEARAALLAMPYDVETVIGGRAVVRCTVDGFRFAQRVGGSLNWMAMALSAGSDVVDGAETLANKVLALVKRNETEARELADDTADFARGQVTGIRAICFDLCRLLGITKIAPRPDHVESREADLEAEVRQLRALLVPVQVAARAARALSPAATQSEINAANLAVLTAAHATLPP